MTFSRFSSNAGVPLGTPTGCKTCSLDMISFSFLFFSVKIWANFVCSTILYVLLCHRRINNSRILSRTCSLV